MSSLSVRPANETGLLRGGGDNPDSDSDYVEKDPAGRYVRVLSVPLLFIYLLFVDDT